jgi:hypothetical protein
MARKQDPWPEAIIIDTTGAAAGQATGPTCEPDLISQALRVIGRPD